MFTIVAMSLDLTTADPLWLARAASLEEILEAVNRVTTWREPAARLLDFAYRQRISWLLRHRGSFEEMAALARHINRVAQHPRRQPALEALKQPYASRWRAYQDLLEDRLAAREQEIPASVKNRRHIAEIVDWIRREQRVPQKAVQNRFDLGTANLSRILTLLEEWEVVMRHKSGRDNFLTPGPRAGEIPAPAQKRTDGPGETRGLFPNSNIIVTPSSFKSLPISERVSSDTVLQ